MTVKSHHPVKVEEEPIRVNYAVFLSSASVILVLAFLIVLYPTASREWLNHAQLWIADMVGWLLHAADGGVYGVCFLVSVIALWPTQTRP